MNAAFSLFMLTEEYRYKIFTLLDHNPAISQRELGISLSKMNYCLKALVEKGMIKAKSFRNSNNKRAYLYILTPQGIEEKVKVTARLLKANMQEYEQLQAEIERVRAGLESDNQPDKQHKLE